MKFYESLIMLRNATTEMQVDELEKALGKLVETSGLGVLVKFDRWGKLKLAHPVEHKDYAYFVLARYKVTKVQAVTFPKELDHLLKVKFNSTVIRFVSIALEEESFNAPYKRPEAFIPSNSMNSTRGSGFGSDKTSFGRRSTVEEEEMLDISVDNEPVEA